AGPTWLQGSSDRVGQIEILRRRDFDVRRLALHQLNAMAGSLDQRRFIGRIFSSNQRVTQNPLSKSLRRLREEDTLAAQRLQDVESDLPSTSIFAFFRQ